MSEFPTEVTISSLAVSIEKVKDLTHADGEKIDGQCCAEEQTVEIDSGVRGHDRLRLVVMHELVHFIEHCAGAALKDPVQIDAFARGIFTMIRDNPEFMAWLIEPRPVRKIKPPATPEPATSAEPPAAV